MSRVAITSRLHAAGVSLALLLVVALFAAACGSESEEPTAQPPSGAPPPPPPEPLPGTETTFTEPTFTETTDGGKEPDGNGASGELTLFEAVDEALASLATGSIAFNTPETLAKGESAEIELLLSPRQSVEQLKDQLAEVGDREGARVGISDEMEATLAGRGFEIEAITPERQVVISNDLTRWKWDVEPTKTGTLRLHLTLTAIVDVEGERRPRTLRTFERTFTIRVSWSERVVGFLGANWQWLWTAIFAPVLLWVVRKRRKQADSAEDSRSRAPSGRSRRPRRRGRDRG